MSKCIIQQQHACSRPEQCRTLDNKTFQPDGFVPDSKSKHSASWSLDRSKQAPLAPTPTPSTQESTPPLLTHLRSITTTNKPSRILHSTIMDGGRAGSGSGSASGSNPGACPFLRRQSVKRSFSTMAEARRSGSPDSESLFVSPDHHYNNTHATHRRPPLALPSNAQRSHYPRDGLDFRRPVTTAAGMGRSTAVIDLTLEEDDSRSARVAPEASSSAAAAPEPGPSRARQQRLPNFQSRNIIDVESDAEREGAEESRGASSGHSTHTQRQHHHPHSPEPRHPYSDRATDNMPRRNVLPPMRAQPRWDFEAGQRSITPHPTGPTAQGNMPIDLTADDDDDVVLTDIRPRNTPQLNLGRPEATAGTGTRSVLDRVYQQFGGRPTFGVAMGAGGIVDRVLSITGHGAARHGLPAGPAVAVPVIDMNYLAVGFAMGPDAARPPTPKYEPPPPAEDGFTRSPGENEEVVCPNCGDELCTGDDIKQEVWVIKVCGHAYCGECAHNRGPAKKAPKGKGKARVEVSSNDTTLRQCQVDGCGKAVSNKAMIRVYVDG